MRTVIDAEGRKPCGHCGVPKPANEDHFSPTPRPNGVRTLHSICRPCRSKANAERYRDWRKLNAEKVKEYNREYYQALKNGDKAPASYDPQLRDALLAEPAIKVGNHYYCTKHARLMPCVACKRERMH